MPDIAAGAVNQSPQVRGIHLSLLSEPSLEADRLSVRRIDSLIDIIDDLPIERVSVGDHQGDHLECYTALGYIAAHTRRLGIGPCVTSGATRDAGVHAAALASLDALSHGRAFAVLARGDGAVRNLGLLPHTVRETRDTLVSIRTLLRDGSHEIDGRHVRMRWPQDTTSRIPLCIAGGGPRMLRAAAAVADELYIAAGVAPDLIADTLAVIDDAVRASGRRRRPVLWWVTPFAITERRDEAYEIVGESLSTIANHALRGADYAQRRVPRDLWPALGEFHRQYDWSRKNASAPGRTNADLMVELGLQDYLLERYAVAGTPQDVVGRLQQLATRGIDRFMLKVNHRDELRMLGEHVLPQVLVPGGWR